MESFKQRLPIDVYRLFKQQFDFIMSNSNLTYEEILDYDICGRILSVVIEKGKKRARYYFRYSILFVYVYEHEDYDNLINIEYHKTIDCDNPKLIHLVRPPMQFHISLMRRQLPTMFKLNYPLLHYKIIYLFSYYPFEDESDEIIPQNYSADDSYVDEPPLMHRNRIGCTMISIEGIEYLIRTFGSVKMKGLYGIKRSDYTINIEYQNFKPFDDILNSVNDELFHRNTTRPTTSSKVIES